MGKGSNQTSEATPKSSNRLYACMALAIALPLCWYAWRQQYQTDPSLDRALTAAYAGEMQSMGVTAIRIGYPVGTKLADFRCDLLNTTITQSGQDVRTHIWMTRPNFIMATVTLEPSAQGPQVKAVYNRLDFHPVNNQDKDAALIPALSSEVGQLLQARKDGVPMCRY